MAERFLQFQSFASHIDLGFWHALAKKKLNELGLSENAIHLTGHFTHRVHESSSPIFRVEHDAFSNMQHQDFQMNGLLINTNTQEDFIARDKQKHLQDLAAEIERDIENDLVLSEPERLNRFLLISFADIKKYRFVYLVGFPTLAPKDPFTATSLEPISSIFDEREINEFKAAVEALPLKQPFFLVKRSESVQVALLRDWSTFFASVPESERIVAFADPASGAFPGWPLRNFLYFLSKKFRISRIRVICYRANVANELTASVLNVQLPNPSTFNVVGWEKQADGKTSARVINLNQMMDPIQLADSALDLNLKLMRWRLVPSLDLSRIQQQKCLLLGMGTLGCNVARTLLAWGVRQMTLVDYGKVSFSNPARQSLFQFDDCLNGGRMKAEAAVEALKRIFPGVTLQSKNLAIPMPGHAAAFTREQLKENILACRQLIDDHDVIFLLMDSRESRWLPTFFSSLFKKGVINVALGFDSFLVMRHGLPNEHESSSLGCYFCNDVVAPMDSMTRRTLDEQCTVTRPGLAPIAAALGVELFVSLLQHPKVFDAPAKESETVLGKVPHQIRGFLGSFENQLISGPAYERCTACSVKVKEAYLRDGVDWIIQVLEQPALLEQVTGLDQLKAETEIALQDLQIMDDFEL